MEGFKSWAGYPSKSQPRNIDNAFQEI